MTRMTQTEPTREFSPDAALEPRAATASLRSRRALPWWGHVGVLLLVFVSGGVVGAMIATQAIYSRLNYYREHAGALPADIVPRLQVRLDLTAKQMEKVRAIIAIRHPRMIENRRQGAQAMLDEFRMMEHEIAGVLDPEQREGWHAIAQSVRQRFLPPVSSND